MKKSYTKYLVILVFCLAQSLNHFTVAQFYANPQDSLILVNFQKAMMEEGWPQFWDTTKLVSTWRGASLDYVTGKGEKATGRVNWISIDGSWFSPLFTTDSLPACVVILKSIDSLESLSFQHLGLKFLPEEICDLKNIESLSLGYNHFTEIPSFLGKMKNLKYLALLYNQLTDLPEGLSGLTTLENLSLMYNETLTGLPNVVTKLPFLTKLDISFCFIKTLPEEIRNLQSLKELSVDHCKLSILPNEIGELPALETLYLNSNKLSALPESMGNLKNLRSLNVSYNNLTELPKSFSELDSLRGIGFSDNQLSSFPACLAKLPKLNNISGERNLMTGNIPAEVFKKKDLRLYLNNNNLSGKLEIQSNKTPKYLYVKNNRFTLKDIIEHYNEFDPDPYNPYGPTYIDFQPQQNIGSFRTLKPAAGNDIPLGIDNYEPATGCEITWYKAARLDETGTRVAPSIPNDTLTIENFDPDTDAGVYYCVVTHPDLEGLNLSGNYICLIGDSDAAPSLHASDVLFRCGTDAILSLTISDDYTRVKDMHFDIPDITRHFILKPDSNNPNKRHILPKEGVLAAVDTVKVSITDDGGNTVSTKAVMTMVPAENEAPQMNFPPVFMSFLYGTPSCVPELPDCNEVYYFASSTFLKKYVTDDFTPESKLTYSVTLDSISGTLPTNNIKNVNLVDELTGENLNTAKALSVTISAVSDVSVYVSLTASDDEGGSATKQILLKGIGMSQAADDPNDPPEIAPIPEQVIEKGSSAFAPLNLKDYISDDYLPFEELDISLSPKSVTANIKNDSMLYISPLYTDSVYSENLTITITERRNLLSEAISEIACRIVQADLAVRFFITANGVPVKDALIYINGAYFSSDAMGHATVSLPNNGSYRYTITDTYMESDTDYRDATGTVTLAGTGITENVQLIPESPTAVRVIFYVTDRGYPVPNALIDINGALYQTDWGGQATVTLPQAGSYNYTVSDIYVGNPVGYQPFSGTVTVTGTDITENVQLILKNVTAINDEPRTTEATCIYPNPVHGMLTIDLPAGTEADAVEVYNITGIKVCSFSTAGQSSVQIDMGDYPEGLYFVRGLLKGKVVFSGKVIRGLP
jgi:Leucine-rich repeat (LRR) protein